MEFKDIQSTIKSGKKEDIAKNWALYMEELKKKKIETQPQKAPAPQQPAVADKELKDARDRLETFERTLAEAQAKLSAQEAQMTAQQESSQKSGADLAALQADLKQKIEALAKADEQLIRLRQDFSTRLIEIDRLNQERESFLEMEKDMRAKSEILMEMEAKLAQNALHTQELLGRLEEKDRELEQARYQLERFQRGEVVRLLEAKVQELGGKIAELEAALAAKTTELDDFRGFLNQRETELTKRREEEAGLFARERSALEEKINQGQTRLKELEAELAGLRRILIKEEERSRQLEIVASAADADRRSLQERLELLTGEMKEHQAKLSRYLTPAALGPSSSAGPAAGVPSARPLFAPERPAGEGWGVSALPMDWGLPAFPEPDFEAMEWDDPLLHAPEPIEPDAFDWPPDEGKGV
ncbi:MAG: hypothetical protein HYT79_10430 [Elusimicrobia bacterium]|nr:hypothetical protein [Elusimicrobiota bacterium]